MIDLRSDLHSLPTEAMWEAMRAAELGWATYGEDASVNRLQERVAELLGKERGLWVPTCGMANLVALLSWCERGSAVVLESQSHVLTSESMGIEHVAGLEPRSLWAPDGRMAPGEVGELVRESAAQLLVLENTHTRAGGTVLDAALTSALADAGRAHGAAVHLDGARLPNAAVALGVPLLDLAEPADSVALSLNKGLGAPMGTILAASSELLEVAHRHLKRLGGASIHKAGIPAAAALVALDEGWEHLADDHRRARELAAGIAQVEALRVVPEEIETNIVLVDVSGTGLQPEEFLLLLAARGVLALERDTSRIRLVTHRGIGDAELAAAVEALAAAAEPTS